MAEESVSYYMSLNYPYELVRDEDQGGYFASHPDLDGCVGEGETAQEAVESLDVARELWIEARLEGGFPVPEPLSNEFSGRVSLRMPSSLHRELAKVATRTGASLNLLLNTALSDYVGGVRQFEDARRMQQETLSLLEKLKAVISEVRQPAWPSVNVFSRPRAAEHTATTTGTTILPQAEETAVTEVAR